MSWKIRIQEIYSTNTLYTHFTHINHNTSTMSCMICTKDRTIHGVCREHKNQVRITHCKMCGHDDAIFQKREHHDRIKGVCIACTSVKSGLIIVCKLKWSGVEHSGRCDEHPNCTPIESAPIEVKIPVMYFMTSDMTDDANQVVEHHDLIVEYIMTDKKIKIPDSPYDMCTSCTEYETGGKHGLELLSAVVVQKIVF